MSPLQDLVVDLAALSLHGKQLHWHVQGSRFRSVHLQIDDVVASARTFTDEIAERAVTRGETVDATPAAIAKEHNLPVLPDGWVRDEDAVRLLADAVERVVERGRRLMTTTEDDLVTQEIVIGVVGTLEKHLWMLRAQLVR